MANCTILEKWRPKGHVGSNPTLSAKYVITLIKNLFRSQNSNEPECNQACEYYDNTLDLGQYRGKFRRCKTCDQIQVFNSIVYSVPDEWHKVSAQRLPANISSSIKNICK